VTRPVRRFAALVSLAAVCAGAAVTDRAAAEDDDTVVLSITGQEGTRVRGRCLAETSEGERTFELDGAVPIERRWRADWLRCELEAQGPVTVEAAGRGSRSRTSSSGGRMTIVIG
jgi:hypothetical protein